MVAYKQGSYLCGAQAKCRPNICRRSAYISRPELESRVTRGLDALIRSLADDSQLVEQANAELAAAFAAVHNKRPHARSGVDTDFTAAGKSHSVLLSSLSGPPKVDYARVGYCASRAAKTLACGTAEQRKRTVVAWVEQVEVREAVRKLVVQYRLPEQLTRPAGLGTWCRQHSKRLRSLLKRQWTLPASALVPAIGSPGRRRSDSR
jgi:hypothetical protein